MQRICNYGSYLQAYGLKKMIESLGHEVVFIDYMTEKPLIVSLKEYGKYVIDCCKKASVRGVSHLKIVSSLLPVSYRTAAQTYSEFRTKYWPILGISLHKQYHTKVDTLVIGSDEVFNCLQSNPDVGFSKELFGENANANRIITYAASFGNSTYEGIMQVGILDDISSLISKYSAISVRDKNSYSIIRKILPDKVISENLDPVLMFDFSKRKRKPVNLSDYIVIYAYRGRLTEEEIETIKRFAKTENKKIVSIGGYHSFADKYIQTSPFHVLDYFENADYVITDTFHGTIFSIINHTKFGVLVRNGHGSVYGNSEKLSDLLSRLNAESRIINKLEDLPKIVKSDYDFDITDGIIKKERIKTMEYLKINL